jgi:hypothetical protein
VQIDLSRSDHARVRFVVAANDHPGVVSVVGSFNGWTPGLDDLVPQADGTRAVTVGVSYGVALTFRYLAENGGWFDDPDADEITAQGCRINASSLERPSVDAPPTAGPM